MKLKTLALTAVLAISSFAHADYYQHIRNATAKIEYAGKTFLVDPYLAKKGAYAGFAGTFNEEKRNPLIELPMPVADVMKGVDAVIVTHTHDDHWDKTAVKLLPKNLPIITQHQADADKIHSQGFTNVSVLNDSMDFNGIKLSKTGGAHGTVEMYAVKPLGDLLGDAMGVIFQAPEHKTVYIMGDTLWTADVNKALNHYQPDVLVMNTGDARVKAFPNNGIIMSKTDVQHATQVAPKAKIIAVHMDAVNHTTVSSEELREYVKKHGLQKQVSVPKEGEVVKF